MSSLINPYSETSSWTYLDNGWGASQNAAGIVTADYTYNARGLVTEISNKNGATALSDFSGPNGQIQYDAVGNMATVAATISTHTGYSGTTNYTHDTKNELTQEQSTAAGGYTNNFAYDNGGNPTTFRSTGTNAYNSDNQAYAFSDSGGTSVGSFSYDGNGNPTTYKGGALAYDAENRLTSYASAMTAAYTGDGLRAWKENSGGKTYFLYDGTKPICELDSSGDVSAANTFGHFGLLSRHTSAGSVFYAFDPHGNVVQRLDSSGTVLSTQTFDAFGMRQSTDSNTDPYAGFGGQAGYYTDWETGLELLTFRYFDPQMGRFLTRDPACYNGGMNLYEYCNNSPTIREDPTGLEENWWSWLGGPWGNIAGALASCGGAAILILFGFLGDDETSSSEKGCNELLGCLIGILSFVVAAALTEEVGPQLAGCLGGIVSSVATSFAQEYCHSRECGAAPIPMGCLAISAFLGALLGCVGQIFPVGKKPIDEDIEAWVRNSVAGPLGQMFGTDAFEGCTNPII